MAHRPIAFATLAIATVGMFCEAQLIDFERLPSGALPKEGMSISNQFSVRLGITFGFTDGRFPRIAEVGAPGTAFWGVNPEMAPDQPRAAQNVGRFFLTDDGVVGGTRPAGLLIRYATPVGAASGVILDIDYTEAWKIEARNARTQVVATVSLDPKSRNAGDGLATPWAILRTQADIHSILITYSGKSTVPGLAFDNFSPSLPITPASTGIEMTAKGPLLRVAGSFGSVYELQYSLAAGAADWLPLTRLVLTNAAEAAFQDGAATNAPMRFYRAIGIE